MKIMLFIAMTLLGIGIVTTSATAAPPVKVRPATTDCAKDDYECRLGVVRKTNARQDLDLSKVRISLNKLATVGERQRAIEAYLQLLPVRIRQEMADEVAKLTDHVNDRMDDWSKKCDALVEAVNTRLAQIQAQVNDVDERVSRLEQWQLGFKVQTPLTGGEGEVEGAEFSPQAGLLLQLRPGKGAFGVELGLNFGRSFRDEKSGGDTMDVSEELLILIGFSTDASFVAGYKGLHGASLDMQATQTHFGVLGLRFKVGEETSFGVLGLLGHGVQAVEVRDMFLGKPMESGSHIEHNQGMRFGVALELAWTP